MGIERLIDLSKTPIEDFDTSEYGLKAKGLAVLHQVARDMADEEREEGYKNYFHLTPSFAIPRSMPIEPTKELKDMYLWLASAPISILDDKANNDIRIIMARSSDENEMPGVFETHFALYDPKNPEESFNNWIKAAEKVRKSGAGGVIGDVLAANYVDPTKDDWASSVDWVSKIQEGMMTDKIKFGLGNFSFVGRTGDIWKPDESTIYCVVGLPSKIVRGDTDYSLIQLHDFDPRLNPELVITHANHDYRFGHGVSPVSSGFPQETIDTIDLSDLAKITTIKYFDTTHTSAIDMFWGAFALPYGANPYGIFNILSRLQDKMQEKVEIEGTYYPSIAFMPTPHIVQLRAYTLPENRLEKLTEVDARKLLVSGKDSYVADRFSGDLVLIPDIEDINRLNESYIADKLQGRNYILVPSWNSVMGRGHTTFEGKFLNRSGLVIPVYHQYGLADTHAAHTHGHMVGILAKLQTESPVVAIAGIEHDLRDAAKKEEYKGFSIIRDVTVESNGRKAQIYLNK